MLLSASLAAQTPQQAPPSGPEKQPATPAKPSGEANPFPEDTGNVPVMPNGKDAAPAASPSSGTDDIHAPSADSDPVRSPDEPLSDTSDSSGESSSMSNLMDKLLPPPDTNTRDKNGKPQPPEHQETSAEDINVGTYYLSNHNWKAALSRFQSALVLDPENPEVYWGMAEAQRHLGDFSTAKANYLKLLDYDPDGKHGKEARKILKDPELAKAAASTSAPH